MFIFNYLLPAEILYKALFCPQFNQKIEWALSSDAKIVLLTYMA